MEYKPAHSGSGSKVWTSRAQRFCSAQAPQAGEIVSFAVEEGQPVEYNQPIVEIAPFFGGHIIGDRKHA